MMPCNKWALNFKSQHFERKNRRKLAIFKSLSQPFASMHFIETWHICPMVRFVSLIKFARICLNILGNTVIQSLKSRKIQKGCSVSCRGRRNLWIYSLYSLPDSKHDQKFYIRILSLHLPEMRPLGTFS